MKQLAFFLALLGLTAVPAIATDWGGISGHVIDVQSGQPIANADVLLYRTTGVTQNRYDVMHLRTNARGFFSKVSLQQGLYVVLARVPGRVQGCAVDNIVGDEMARVTVKVGYKALLCSGPRYAAAMVNPNAGGDLHIR